MKKLMLALMAAQAMILAVPMPAHADVLNLHPGANLQPIAALEVFATVDPDLTVYGPFSG